MYSTPESLETKLYSMQNFKEYNIKHLSTSAESASMLIDPKYPNAMVINT